MQRSTCETCSQKNGKQEVLIDCALRKQRLQKQQEGKQKQKKCCKGALQKLAESFNGNPKPKTGQGEENNCIAQEEVEAEGDEAKKKTGTNDN